MKKQQAYIENFCDNNNKPTQTFPLLPQQQRTTPPTASTTTPANICSICGKQYFYKIRAEECFMTCSFISQSKKEYKDKGDLLQFPTHTNKELTLYVRSLIVEMEKMKKEIASLKRRQKPTDYLEILNQCPPPETTFETWLAETTVDYTHLKVVFEETLEKGICKALETNLKAKECVQTPPLRAFEEKQLFVYTTASAGKWKKATDEEEIRHLYYSYFQKIVAYYTKWTETQNNTCAGDGNDGVEIDYELQGFYMGKIMGGGKSNDEKRIRYIRTFLMKIL